MCIQKYRVHKVHVCYCANVTVFFNRRLYWVTLCVCHGLVQNSQFQLCVGWYLRTYNLLPCTCLTTSCTVLPGLHSQHTLLTSGICPHSPPPPPPHPLTTPSSLSSTTLNTSLPILFVSWLTLLILSLQKRDGLPALLVYQNGEMVGNLLKVTDDLGVEFEMEDVETFLQEWAMLVEALSIVPVLVCVCDVCTYVRIYTMHVSVQCTHTYSILIHTFSMYVRMYIRTVDRIGAVLLMFESRKHPVLSQRSLVWCSQVWCAVCLSQVPGTYVYTVRTYVYTVNQLVLTYVMCVRSWVLICALMNVSRASFNMLWPLILPHAYVSAEELSDWLRVWERILQSDLFCVWEMMVTNCCVLHNLSYSTHHKIGNVNWKLAANR